MSVIAIDLGSNTLRVLQYECSSGKRLAEYEKIVRTADSLHSKGIVDESALDAILSGLKEAQKKIDFSGCKIRAVTTEALRTAKNAQEVMAIIKKSSSISFEVIAPEMEATLTLNAVKSRLEILGIEQNFVLVDIGGGSTELSFYLNGRIVTQSFRLGIVTVANESSSLDEIKEIVAPKAKEIAEFAKEYLGEDLLFVATAGTPTTIAAMKLGMNYKTYNPDKINGVQLRREELDYYLIKLLDMSKSQREIAVGVGRDDLIVAGIIIFEEIYKILDKDEAIIIDDGLREGVALSLCKEQ